MKGKVIRTHNANEATEDREQERKMAEHMAVALEGFLAWGG